MYIKVHEFNEIMITKHMYAAVHIYKLMRTFGQCLIDVKVTLFQTFCIAFYCSFL